jgi:heme-degrading monooxygenase HmoA
MVTEIADFTVLAGHEDAFCDAYLGVRHLLHDTPGCRSVRMTRSIESPRRFVLLVEWESVEAHDVDFRDSDRFGQWRAAIGPHFDGPPHVEHVRDVDDA